MSRCQVVQHSRYTDLMKDAWKYAYISVSSSIFWNAKNQVGYEYISVEPERQKMHRLKHLNLTVWLTILTETFGDVHNI